MLTLLLTSGGLTAIAAVVFLSLPRMPAVLSTSLADFDAVENYPQLPFWGNLQNSEASIELKPLVLVVFPISRLWGGRAPTATAAGAAALLMANKDGYLFATAKQMVATGNGMPRQVMVATAAGTRALAEVIASAPRLDLALLWVRRGSGHAAFSQPIAKASEGQPVFVIGHPDGLNYTLSAANVSSLKTTDMRIPAITVGNAGGPVYDLHGNLLGIVGSKLGERSDKDAESPSLATVSEGFEDAAGWKFTGDGELRLRQYIQALDAK